MNENRAHRELYPEELSLPDTIEYYRGIMKKVIGVLYVLFAVISLLAVAACIYYSLPTGICVILFTAIALLYVGLQYVKFQVSK